MQKETNSKEQYFTGDQPKKYLRRRIRGDCSFWEYQGNDNCLHNWNDVENWRSRWTAEKVIEVLKLLGHGEEQRVIGEATGFGVIRVDTIEDRQKNVADLRGLDLALIPPKDRSIGRNAESIVEFPYLDLSYAKLEGSRLTGLGLINVNLHRAHLQKATLRNVNFSRADLSKAHLEDADIRGAVLEKTNLAHIRYTEDGIWWRGTVLMETHLEQALFVDPLLLRCAQDQYYLYVLKYRNRHSLLSRFFFSVWRITCNYGKSPLLWAGWSVLLAMFFSGVYWSLGENAFSVDHLEWSFPTVIYYSVVTFTTLGFGDITPKTQPAAWWVMAEVVVGYVMLGGLISIFATKLARRS